MKSAIKHYLAALILCQPLSAYCDTPPASAVQQVVGYYFSEDPKPILADIKLCADIYRQGSDKYNCHGELDPSNLTAGEAVYVWMNYMVPKDQKLQMLLQTNYQGVTRHTYNFGIKSGFRYRVWKKIALDKTGQWDLPIFYENDNGLHELSSIAIQVNGPSFAANP